jgi:hypothetical protein
VRLAPPHRPTIHAGMESKKQPLSSLYEDPVPAVKKTSARAQSSEEENWSIGSLKQHPPPPCRLSAHIDVVKRIAVLIIGYVNCALVIDFFHHMDLSLCKLIYSAIFWVKHKHMHAQIDDQKL